MTNNHYNTSTTESNSTEETPSDNLHRLSNITEKFGVRIAEDDFDPHNRYENDDAESIVECEVSVHEFNDEATVAIDAGIAEIKDHRTNDGLDNFDDIHDLLEDRVDLRRRGSVGILEYNLDRHVGRFIPEGRDDEAVQLPIDDPDRLHPPRPESEDTRDGGECTDD